MNGESGDGIHCGGDGGGVGEGRGSPDLGKGCQTAKAERYGVEDILLQGDFPIFLLVRGTLS